MDWIEIWLFLDALIMSPLFSR
uniref:Uncharacterized protein n=1 Tax=Arundo donax TaxID=35708 RepID=A0A0A9FSV7_ARUDO